MRAIDLFCGAGGLTRGLLDAGIDVVGGIDLDDRCRESYESNNAPAQFVCSDVSTVTVEDIATLTDVEETDDLLLAGCAPCQPFSQQRRGDRRRGDATLLREFGRLVGEVLPAQVLIENVPGMARVQGNSTFRRFVRLLRDNDYRVVSGVLDAKHYGVPQSRRRLVLIAMRNKPVTLPQRECGRELQPFATVRSAIERFPAIEAGGADLDTPNHVAASITDINIERLRNTPPDGGDRRAWPEHLRLACHGNGYEGHTDVYGRMRWDAPSPTLTGRCHSISNGRYGHPVQDRAISLREAAAIQTFPDDYVFYESNKHIALQIGNAVPVRLAQALGRHIVALSEAADGT